LRRNTRLPRSAFPLAWSNPAYLDHLFFSLKQSTSRGYFTPVQVAILSGPKSGLIDQVDDFAVFFSDFPPETLPRVPTPCVPRLGQPSLRTRPKTVNSGLSHPGVNLFSAVPIPVASTESSLLHADFPCYGHGPAWIRSAPYFQTTVFFSGRLSATASFRVTRCVDTASTQGIPLLYRLHCLVDMNIVISVRTWIASMVPRTPDFRFIFCGFFPARGNSRFPVFFPSFFHIISIYLFFPFRATEVEKRIDFGFRSSTEDFLVDRYRAPRTDTPAARTRPTVRATRDGHPDPYLAQVPPPGPRGLLDAMTTGE